MAVPVIRRYRPGDERAINDAFTAVFGQRRSLAEWRWKFPPERQPVPVLAAWDGDEVVACCAGIPARFWIGGRVRPALQIVDTFSVADARRRREWRGLWQEVMDAFAATFGGAGGASLLYGFPGWKARQQAVARCGYDAVPPQPVTLLGRSTGGGRTLGSRRYRARPAADHELDLDLLWRRTAGRYRAAVVRDAERSAQRLAGNPAVTYHRFVITPRWSRRPVAFVAFRSDGGRCRWVDLVWEEEHPGALELVDHLSRRLALQVGAEREELWLSGDRVAEELLRRLGFAGEPGSAPVQAIFRFLDADLRAEALTGHLYVTMADADLV